MSPATTRHDVLSKAQLTAINKALAGIDTALQLCDMGDNCNANTGEARQVLEQMRQDFNNWKANFFPNTR